MADVSDGFEMARAFDATADAIKTRLFSDWDKLKKSDRETLDGLFWKLQSLALSLRTASVGKLLAEANTSVLELGRVTERASGMIKKLDNIRKVIKVATAVFGLVASVAASVAAPNPASIVAAFQSLKQVVDAVEGA